MGTNCTLLWQAASKCLQIQFKMSSLHMTDKLADSTLVDPLSGLTNNKKTTTNPLKIVGYEDWTDYEWKKAASVQRKMLRPSESLEN